MSSEQLVLLPLWYVVFLLSVTCHEAAHAAAAYYGGDRTAYLGGQVSLNPLPHIQREPIGTVAVPFLSYLFFGASQPGSRWMIGWASAPYDPVWEERYPERAALMAFAGPTANLLLASVGFAILKVGLTSGWWHPYSTALDHLVTTGSEQTTLLEGLGRFCSVLFGLNVLLMLFNLLPIPPMDGASVLAGFVRPWRRLREAMRASPMLALLGLIVAWQIFRFLFAPLYSMLVMSFLFA